MPQYVLTIYGKNYGGPTGAREKRLLDLLSFCVHIFPISLTHLPGEREIFRHFPNNDRIERFVVELFDQHDEPASAEEEPNPENALASPADTWNCPRQCFSH